MLVFEDAEGDVDEFGHDGADHCHFGFAGSTESASEVLQGLIIFDGDQGWHVEGFAQMTITLFAYAFVAPHGGTALFAPGRQAGMSGGLACAAHLIGSNHFRQKDGGGE